MFCTMEAAAKAIGQKRQGESGESHVNKRIRHSGKNWVSIY